MSERHWLKSAWSRLESASRNHPAMTVEGAPLEGLLVAISTEGMRQVLVPVSRLTLVDESIGTREVVVRNATFPVRAGSLDPFVAISCVSEELHDAFDALIEALIAALSSGLTVEAAIVRAVDQMRRLTRPQGTVDPERLLGAIGELLLLEELVRIDPVGMNAWVGWRGQRHDFMAGHDGIEVKASGRADAAHVTIHGVAQLEPAEEGRLWLHHFRLEQSAGGSASLVSVDRLVGRLEALGVPRGELLERLSGIAIEPDAAGWGDTFRFAGREVYEVRDGFPRVLGSAMPAGASSKIDKLQYRVNLGEARDFLLDEKVAGAHLPSFMEALS